MLHQTSQLLSPYSTMLLPTTKNAIATEVVFPGHQHTLRAVEWDISIRLYEWAIFGWIVRRGLQLVRPFSFPLFTRWWSFTPFLHFYIFCDSEIITTPNHTLISSAQHICWLFFLWMLKPDDTGSTQTLHKHPGASPPWVKPKLYFLPTDCRIRYSEAKMIL